MGWLDDLKLGIRRGEGPVFAPANRLAKAILGFHLPDSPVVRTLARGAYHGYTVSRDVSERVKGILWAEPLFRSRCEEVGSGFYAERVPYIEGHTKIYIGDNVSISGDLVITTGRFTDQPTLRIGNNVFIGHGTTLVVNREMTIGDYTSIAGNVRIADSDGHPPQWDRRAAKDELREAEMQPVTIGKHVWIGASAQILKGVTIGDRAIIGAGAVVMSDIPADTLAMGSPARKVRGQTQ